MGESEFMVIFELRCGNLDGDMTVSNRDYDNASADIVFKHDADFLGSSGGSTDRVLQGLMFGMQV
jgi:hypothetical protein